MRAAFLRTSLAWLAAWALACALGGPIACGPPESFDGLVGGSPEAGSEADAPAVELLPDPELAPPRPIAPLSQSWINGTRPRFEWQLASGATGARIELCRTRACDGEKKTLDVAGNERTLDEDLAPGTWFWRLVSTTPESVGTKPSPVWALLVRGGPSGKSAPNGSIVDVNGDGRADLLVTLEYESGAGATFIELVALLASNDDSTSFVTTHGTHPVAGAFVRSPDPPIAANDIDGDGISDVVFADVAGSGAPAPILVTVPGSATVADALDVDRATLASLPPLDSTPNLAAVGDLDRDGWGDVAVTTARFGVATFGTRSGLGPFQYLLQLGPGPSNDAGAPRTSAFALTGALDRDGDGLSDLVLESAEPEAPFFLYSGDAARVFRFEIPTLAGAPAIGAASAFAAGDFDGDGLGDVAFVTSAGGKPAICFSRGSEPVAGMRLVCWSPAAPSAGFGSSISAGDVDADGRDELIVGSTDAGIDILGLDAKGMVAAQHLDTPFGTTLTTILPGRPAPAVWAATRADGRAIGVFAGSVLATSLDVVEAMRFGRTIR